MSETYNEMYNLDATLSKFIHDKLVEFKKFREESYFYIMIYSHEIENGTKTIDDNDITDDTNWLLDEFIWTFKTIAADEDYESPSLKIIMRDLELINSEKNFMAKISSIREHELYDDYIRETAEQEERIKRNLHLFGKYFRSLWI
jgi:hypothetical protein